MELTVQRRWCTEHSTIGLMSLDDVFYCYTLEPELRADDVKPRAIPAGRYRVTWRYSPKHQRFLPHVENVPGFLEIEIHIGNFGVEHTKDGKVRPPDTEGCCCVGKSYSPQLPDFIGQSTDAFNPLAARVEDCDKRGEEVWITYVDPPKGN